MSIQLPKFFDQEKAQRLEAIEERKEAIEEERDPLRDRKTECIASGELKDAEEAAAGIAALDREEADLEIEGARLEAFKEIDEWVEGKDVRTNLAVAEIIMEIVPAHGAPMIEAALGTVLDLFEKVDATHARYRKLVAKQRRNAFQAYLDEKFTEEQAMRLVEIDAQVHPLKALKDNFNIQFKGGERS